MITNIEEFFAQGCGRCERFATPECSAKVWGAGLHALRQLCLQLGLEETVKWGHPCYMHAGRNIVILGALRGEFRMSFFHSSLLKDPFGILQKQGPNTQHPDMLSFTDVGQVLAKQEAILAYLQEAMGYAQAGIKPTKEERTLEFPDELVEALEADPTFAEAFFALTPGRQRSYVIALNGAKKSETRLARIVAFRPRIFAGKGALERI